MRSVYEHEGWAPGRESSMWRFASWLPARNGLRSDAHTIILTCDAYARRLGLRGLAVAFSGYWPERGAFNRTGTFKDLEAGPVMAFARSHGIEALVVASMGNTARAFAHACSVDGMRCIIVVPEQVAQQLWLTIKPGPCVTLVAVRGQGTYGQAIDVANRIAAAGRLMIEGGARNPARRDGLATVLASYVLHTGVLPEHYIQAVGSGAGAIATYEAAIRFRAQSRGRCELPRLHLVQNASFAPIHESWTGMAAAPSDDRSAGMYAAVLASPCPPFHEAGGVKEALSRTAGSTYGVSPDEAIGARGRFERAEGVMLNEAAACACAGLEKALALGSIRRDERILLNVTGGGDDFLRRDFQTYTFAPALTVNVGASEDDLLAAVEA